MVKESRPYVRHTRKERSQVYTLTMGILEAKKVAGGPATADRAEIRNQCSPKGPVGFLLESLHLQAATMDEGYKVQQHNQQRIDLVNGPVQMIAPLMNRMAARNRTRRAEDRRFETQGLHEIDTYATNAKHKKGVNGDKTRSY